MWNPFSSEVSVTCNWELLRKTGSYVTPFLGISKKFIHYPAHAVGPLPQLALKYCVDERVGFVAVVAVAATAAATLLTLGAMWSCVECKPLKAGRRIMCAAAGIAVPTALLYVSDKLYK